MIVVRAREKQTAANAWGHDKTFFSEVQRIEESDVGRTLPHFGGYQRPGQKIKRDDVGRERIVYTDGTGWTNWIWKPQ